MIATRSHSCSASSIACVVSSTVTPRSRRSRTSCHVVARGVRVHAGGRLVEEHDLGPADRARTRATAAGPARPRGAAPACATDVAQADDVEQRSGDSAVVVVRGEQPQQLERPQARVQAALLEHHADLRAELAAVAHGIEPEDAHRAGVGACGSPRGSRRSSSCPRRSDRAARTPRRAPTSKSRPSTAAGAPVRLAQATATAIAGSVATSPLRQSRHAT